MTAKRESSPRKANPDMTQTVISTCSKCGARWFGAIACHCAHCHETFQKLTAFDAHFDPPVDENTIFYPNRSCIPAADLPSIGMIQVTLNVWTVSE